MNTASAPLGIVILAAGKGTRMNSDIAKVLHEMNGRPLIHYVIEQTRDSLPEKTVIIIGHQREAVTAVLQEYPVDTAVQDPQLGTGHAVQQAEAMFDGFTGDILVLSGDVPLLRRETIAELVQVHRDTKSAITVLTAYLEDPTGYGRVVRSESNAVRKIVEHRDATPEELELNEINTGIYLFRSELLFERLHALQPDNAQGEYYLTDVVKMAAEEGLSVQAVIAADPQEIQGINTVAQLQEMERNYLARL